MYVQKLAPLAAALMLVACGNDSDQKGGNAFEQAVQEAQSNRENSNRQPPANNSKPPARSTPQADPDTAAEQFAPLGTTSECLGVAWNITDDRDSTRQQMASALNDPRLSNESDPFAMKDAMTEAEQSFEAMAAPYANKRLFVYTANKRQTKLSPYNMQTQTFKDNGGLTGIVDQVFTNPGVCSFTFTNKKSWGGGVYLVGDESQARAVSAQISSNNVHAKYFMQVDGINTSTYKWPVVEATLLRIELVDSNGAFLARAMPPNDL